MLVAEAPEALPPLEVVLLALELPSEEPCAAPLPTVGSGASEETIQRFSVYSGQDSGWVTEGLNAFLETLLGVTEAHAELRFSKSGETGVGVPARVKPLTTLEAAGASVGAGGPYEMSP